MTGVLSTNPASRLTRSTLLRSILPLPDRSLLINSAETLHGDDPAIVRRAAAAAATAPAPR